MTPALLVPLVVMVPLAGAAAALMFPKRVRIQGWITVAALVSVAALGGYFMWATDTHGALVAEMGGWEAPVGVTLVVDRLSAILVTTSAIVLLSVLVFSLGQGLADGDEETPLSIYFPSYLVLAAGVFDAFVAADLFNLYVAFEILLVASYVLLTMGGTPARIRAGLTYIVVSLISSILFLTSLGLIYSATGTVNFAQLSARVAELPADLQLTLNLLIVIAFGIKAAVFPLSLWLPDSYPTAPAPVTAVFAGLLTKVGIYAILRTESLVFSSVDLTDLLMWMAALTMVVGVLGAVSQRDVKRTLSFILVSHIGYLVFGIALGTELGYSATVYYIVHHIIVQTTMFLALGLVERIGGSTSLLSLSGLLKASPILGVMYFIPLLNLGGIPPFSGFIGKVGLFTAGAEEATPAAYWLIGVGALVSLLTLYALTRTWALAFWRETPETDDTAAARTLERLAAAPNQQSLQESRRVPKLMWGATTAMIAVSLLLTVLAQPLVAYSERAGSVLNSPGDQAAWYFDRFSTEEVPE